MKRSYSKILFVIKIFCVLVLTISLLSCSTQFSEEVTGERRILILSDVHISSSESKDNRLKSLIESINSGLLNVEEVIITGDCVSSIYPGNSPSNHTPENSRLLRLQKILSRLSIPYYLAMGNHEYKIDKSKDSDDPFDRTEIIAVEDIWKNVTGFDPYYSVENDDIKYIFLNSMRGRYLFRNFDPEQIDWFENELDTEKSVLLFFHHPIETDNFRIWCKPKDLITDQKESRFFELLNDAKSRINGIFVGHGHMWVSDKLYDEIPVFETNSFGDAENLTFSILGIGSNERISVVKYDDVELSDLEKE